MADSPDADNQRHEDAYDEAARASLDSAEQYVLQRSEAIAARLLARDKERNAIAAVYRKAWDDFYDWEPEPCHSLIRSLIAAPTQAPWDEADTAVPFCVSDESMDVDEVANGIFQVFDMERERVSMLDVDNVRGQVFALHPKYEACTPTSQNIKTDDDESEWLRFVSYAGEPGFDEEQLARDHKHFYWQDVCRDPDADLIGLETIHRLEAQSFSYNVVDTHSVLPRLLGHNGLIGRIHKRDLWHWPDVPELPHVELDDYTLKTQVNEYVDKTCPHVGCLYSLCFPHKQVNELLSGQTAHIKSVSLKQQIQRPCGDMCCVIDRPEDDIDNPAMTDAQCINDILSILPDEMPCTIASIAMVPCYQVFMNRCQLFPDHSIVPARGVGSIEHMHPAPPVQQFSMRAITDPLYSMC
ncbi:uncharacterized protein B0H18DRAFT_53638 [Fomitopsis serialis]|uniref:uncharacterized protein n=1 Tax=Fomitopsis serialis TaxID=139415 RepID=UPI00200816FB|nr:uncharacterized protein B0H18DRAFT_53638 [Neoantrodia serialis]KAH9932336.1 hypothetical protein B0H18DRAFT_53638 [Neoantrodia serialis]